jgi:DNA-damage-inducible protein D
MNKILSTKRLERFWEREGNEKFLFLIDFTSSPKKYWNALKTNLKAEGSKLSHVLGQLKNVSRRR